MSSQHNRVIFKLHQLVGSENVSKLGAIQTYFHKANIIKQDYIDYLKVMATVMSNSMDDKQKKEFMDSFWGLQFGEEKESTVKQSQKAFQDIKEKFKEIIALGGEELYGNETGKLNTFKEWMK